jgi:hypothetical protein
VVSEKFSGFHGVGSRSLQAASFQDSKLSMLFIQESELNNDRKPYQWNITRIARRFGLHRDTVRRRLIEAEVAPAGYDETGAQTYDLADAAPAIFANESPWGASPDCQLPIDRLRWFQSEMERLKFEVTTGKLRSAEEVRRDMAYLAKAAVNTLDSIPDILERDCGLAPEKIQQAADSLDRVREDLYQTVLALVAEEPEQVTAPNDGADQ